MARVVVAFVCGLLVAATGVRAGAPADSAGSDPGTMSDRRGRDRCLAVGPAIGACFFDPALANYHWDTHPALQSGVQATLYWNRLAAGARLTLAHTTQASGIPGAAASPRVNLTGITVVGEGRIVTCRGVSLWGSARAGQLLLGYDPDRMTFDTGGSTGTITVDFSPISEWSYGLGIEVRGDLTRQLALALQAESTTFALDTAHRRGSEIVESRERFFSWEVGLHLSWLVSLN
jgi:hypothetical protein